jgi:putative membrane protein
MTPTGASHHVYSAPREWTRVHPVSPYLGSGPILGFIALYWLARILPSWVAGGSSEYEFLNQFPIVELLLGVVVIIGLVIGFGVLSWRRNEFRIGDDAMHHRKGILFRQHRQARLDRIEAVDVVQPLLARVFGLAQLNVQVAGGRGSGIDLKYLRLGDADALRNEVLALAAGAKLPDAVAGSAAEGDQSVGPASIRDLANHIGETRPMTAVPAAPETDVYTVPTARLLASVALSTPTFVVALAAVGLVIAAVFLGSAVGAAILAFVGTSLFAMIGFLAAIFGYFWNQINGGFQFTAATSPDGLRLRHGLLETRRQTVAPGRVQAVLVSQGVLWRARGWYRITMNVAGYQDDQQRVNTLLPVGTIDDVLLALRLVLPQVSDESLAAIVTGRGGDGGFTGAPRRARLLDPFQWRRRGVLAGERALFIRGGWLTHELAVVPHERTQSLGVSQGPVQRLRHLGSLVVHSTPGPVRPVAANLDADAALDLLDQQAERARLYRTLSHG